MYAGRAEYLGSPVSRASRLWAGCSAGQVRRLPVTKPHVCCLKCICDRIGSKHLDTLALDFQYSTSCLLPRFHFSQLVRSKAFNRVLKFNAMHRSLYALTVCSPHHKLKAVVVAA